LSHENFSLPCSARPSAGFLFQTVVESGRDECAWCGGAASVMGPRGRGPRVLALADLLSSMDFDNMDDTGMYVWAVVLTAAGLLASWGIAVAWQRWRASKNE
jgi:hypothetical protein